MGTFKNTNNKFPELRKNAEKKLLTWNGIGDVNAETLIEIEHELNVHKIELEMQNVELRATQLKLQKSLENYEELFEFAPIGYFILNREGVIEKVNDTGSILLGIRKPQLIGAPFSVFISSELYQDNFYRHRNDVIETERTQQVECKIRKSGTTEFPALITSAFIKDEQGNFKHFLSTVSDITERKEQELRFKVALAKEIELNELKSRFISTASHEFRTPLSTILLSNELLEKYNSPADEDKRKKHFFKIKTAVQGLTEILIDFLSLNKFEEGLVKNNPVSLNLVTFTKSIAEELNIKRQPIVYRHSGEEQVVNLDPKLLKVCLTNLVGNAIKYSHKKGVITIATRIFANGKVKISVKDEGIGIAECDKPFIFDQFFRAKNAEAYQGTGLGLNIVQKFVAVMNGEISFTSTENKGSTFLLTFPKK